MLSVNKTDTQTSWMHLLRLKFINLTFVFEMPPKKASAEPAAAVPKDSENEITETKAGWQAVL